MPNEERISKLVTIFEELGSNIGKGAVRIVPNNEVVDDSPADLPAGYIKVADELGYYVPAVVVANLVVATGQFVNLLYVEGTEPIAFQQGSSGTTNVALWQLVGGTGPDIYYSNGNVGIGKTVAPDAALEILDTSQAQLRLTFEEDVKFTTFTVDTSHNLTIDPSSTGLIKLAATVTVPNEIQHEGDLTSKMGFAIGQWDLDVTGINMIRAHNTTQDILYLGDVARTGDVDVNIYTDHLIVRPTTDTITAFQILDANGGTPVFNVDATNERVGVGTAAPGFALDVQTSSNGAQRILIKNASAGTAAETILQCLNNISRSFQAGITSSANTATLVGGGNAFFQSNTTNLIVRCKGAGTFIQVAGGAAGTTEWMRFSSGGDIGIGTTSPQGRLHAYDTISGFILYEFDGLDATVRTIIPNGTGDVLYRLTAMYVLRDSAAVVASGTADVSNSASVNLTVGGNTVRLRVNADGSTDIARTAGTDTIKVALVLRWL